MTFGIESGYLIGSLILGIPFICIFIARKDLQREMLFGGLLLLPFAVFAPFYIPEYWNPPYYFRQVLPFALGIEDFIFCFFVGGISAVLYEFVENKREIKMKKGRKTINWEPYIFVIVLLITGEMLFPKYSILTLSAIGIIVAAYMIIKRIDLLSQSLAAGVFFMLLYFIFFNIFNVLYPDYIRLVYQHANLFRIYVAGIPLEELLFAFSAGACWSIAYEYMLGYKTN